MRNTTFLIKTNKQTIKGGASVQRQETAQREVLRLEILLHIQIAVQAYGDGKEKTSPFNGWPVSFSIHIGDFESCEYLNQF